MPNWGTISAAVLLSTLCLLYSIYRRDYLVLSEYYRNDPELPDVGGRYDAKTIRKWVSWRQWTSKRVYRTFKTILLVHIVGAHLHLVKGIVGLSAAAIAYNYSSESSVVAGATVFYAGMLYLSSEFHYSALLLKFDSFMRTQASEGMDTLGATIELKNSGSEDSESVQVQGKFVDPVRGISTGWTDLEEHSYVVGNQSKVDSDESLYIRSGNFRKFLHSSSNLKGGGNRSFHKITFNNTLGHRIWVVVRASSPNSIRTSYRYKSVTREQSLNPNWLKSALNSAAQKIEEKRTRLGLDGPSVQSVEKSKGEEETTTDGEPSDYEKLTDYPGVHIPPNR